MEKALTIVLAVVNCVVAAVVLFLILTDPKREHTPSRTCHITYNNTDVEVTCNGLSLSTVPKSLPINATIIDLRFNNLNKITNNSFGCLDQLWNLDLRDNFITYIEQGSFHCLPKLSVLDLSGDILKLGYKSLPVGLFSKLKHLKKLEIDDVVIYRNWSYPEMTFMDLTNLESLTLKTPPVLHFGISFSKMVHLKELCLFVHGSGRFSLDTFVVFSGHDIHSLKIYNYGNSIQVDNMSFKYFPQLQILTLRQLHMCLRSTLESLKAFSGMNMSLISLQNGYFSLNVRCNMVLSPDDTKHLVSLCVEKVYLNYYGIRVIQRGTFNQEPFSKCIKYLDLSNNCIVAKKEVYLEFQGLLNLEYLNIKMGLCFKTIDIESGYDSTSNESKISKLRTSSDRNDYAWNDATRGLRVLCHGNVLHVNVPKKLKTLIMSDLFQQISFRDCTINVHGAENLEHLDVSNWGVDKINSKILGVTNLSSVNYAGNFWLTVYFFVFNGSPNINNLTLRHNTMFVDRSTAVNFDSLFSFFRKLKYLSVSSSAIEYFPFKPGDLSNLSVIDLSNNEINTLSSEVREGLDQLVRKGHRLSLDLHGNLFSCSCNSLSFVVWMVETDINLTNWELYKCMNEDGEVVNLSKFAASHLKHWRKCYSRYCLAFTVSLSFLFTTVLVIGVMFDKYSLRLRCIILKWFGLRFQVPKRKDFLYDVFVYYSSKDDHTWVCNTFRQKMEEERGLRLCIPDRDFVPGSCTAEEIIEAIHKSWKTVVYMTEVFLEDELCFFTLSSAVYASTNEMPNRLILVYSDRIFNRPLPPIVTQLLDGDDNFMLEELEEPEQWDILYRKTLCWV